MIKSWGDWVILVSAHGPNPSFFYFIWRLLFNLGVRWDKGLDSDLDQSLIIHILNNSQLPILTDKSVIMKGRGAGFAHCPKQAGVAVAAGHPGHVSLK